MKTYKNHIPEEVTADYSNSGLTAIPQNILGDVQWQKLDLSYNEITTLEPIIGQFKNLRYLDLSSNQLTDLPASIKQLKQLEVLILSNNPWQSFPEVITELTSLRILKIKGRTIQTIPPSIANLNRLEELNLSFNPLKELPFTLSTLPSLTSLSCVAHQFERFPDVLLEMDHLSTIKSLDLSVFLQVDDRKIELFFRVLKHLRKQKASLESKRAAFYIFLKEGTVSRLKIVFPLLLVNYIDFGKVIREFLYQYNSQPLTSNSRIAVVGKMLWIDRENIEGIMELQTVITDETTHVVIGTFLNKKVLQSLRENLTFISEKTLLEFAIPKQPASWLEAYESKIRALIMSEQNENISIALQIAKESALLDHFLTELLLAYTWVEPSNNSLRADIKALFYIRIPNFEEIILPNPSFRFYTPHKSEENISLGIKNITAQTPLWDGVKIAQYLWEKYQAGYLYLLNHTDQFVQVAWLEQFVEGSTIKLTTLSKLKELPVAITHFSNLKIVDLSGCGFRKFPSIALLEQLPALEQIDLRNNPISFVPKKLHGQVAKYRVYLTK